MRREIRSGGTRRDPAFLFWVHDTHITLRLLIGPLMLWWQVGGSQRIAEFAVRWV